VSDARSARVRSCAVPSHWFHALHAPRCNGDALSPCAVMRDSARHCHQMPCVVSQRSARTVYIVVVWLFLAGVI